MLVVILGFIAAGEFLASLTSTSGGEIAVVRNGGPFDNHRIRQVIDPGSSLTSTGLYSETHRYPAQQRFYTITSVANEGDRGGVDVVQVPSKDGVEMGIEGTLYFSLNLDHSTLRSFDDKFGTRKFVSAANGKYYSAWSGDKGWSAFLDTIIRPVIDNDLREQINNFSCADLVSSCALVQLGANQQAGASAAISASSSNGNITAVQDAINKSLAADLRATLGAEYLTGLRFNLVRITLPANVQTAVNNAQAAFADITQAQAKVAQAKADAEANRQRQAGYSQCPACAAIDELKAIPPNVTTYAPGAGIAVSTGK
jgi:regulator of protease activity HflC (stomatin/prohibitin superfamily)